MLVYVVNLNNNPLMPCKPSKARKLLRDKKAKVIRREPFTIKLNWLCEENVKDLQLNLDSGSKVIGSAVVDEDNQVYYLSEIHLRQDIKSKLDQRRMYRRTRRNRKTRYRKARFLNRRNSIRKDRYSPTLRSKYSTHIKEMWFVNRILPIKNLVIETGKFDIHALSNPNVLNNHILYQKGLKFGYTNTRHYILSRDNYTCQYCKGKSKDNHLNVHHLIERSNNGSDLPNNLITLCKTCHDKLHNNLIILNKSKIKSLLNHPTHMNILGSMFRKYIPNFIETYGYVTKCIREYYNIPKSHCYDAICMYITKDIKPKLLHNKVLIKRCISHGRYQLTWGIKSEKTYPKGKTLGFKQYDKVLYNKVKYFVKGRMSSGYAILSDIFGNNIKLKPIPKFNLLKRISSRKTWITQEFNI